METAGWCQSPMTSEEWQWILQDSGLLLKQGLDWDWTGDGLEMDWSISHS